MTRPVPRFLVALGVFAAAGITALRQGASNNTSFRTTPTIDWTDNVTWNWGNHTISFGGQNKLIYNESTATAAFVPSIGFAQQRGQNYSQPD